MVVVWREPAEEVEETAVVGGGCRRWGWLLKLVIDQKICKFFHRLLKFDLLWFSCGIYKRSRISLCIFWHFDDSQAQLISLKPHPIMDLSDLNHEKRHPYPTGF